MLSLLFLPLFLLATAEAKLIQIIHTNDLHSFFNGTRNGLGGYARVKTMVDKLKAEARAKGIPTLYLDAGDFGEGSSFYFSNQGADSLRALDLLGVDVSVLGNHDYILGGSSLKQQIVESNLKTPILSANLVGKIFMGLENLMPDNKDFDVEGMKVRVFGLTTQEIHFQYPLRPLGFIAPSHNIGIMQAEKAKKDGVDFLIALTHTGINKDIELARNTYSVDLIVGGHDHFRLREPEMVENLHKELIPVVQAGSHGAVVGEIIMDIKGKGVSELVSYKQHEITKNVPAHEEMNHFVGEAYMNREQYFGRDWNEIIGTSEIVLNGSVGGIGQNKGACWSHHMARLMRTTAKTDISMQFDTFQGEEIPAGPIRYGDIVDNFPHFRSWGDKGWSVARAWVNGWILKKVVKLLNSPSANFVGMTVDGIMAEDKERGLIPYNAKIHRPSDARVQGTKIQNLRFYSLAFPSEIPYALMKTTGLASYIIRNTEYLEDTNFWPLLEDYIRKNSPLKCLEN
jgi:5'-nucleotidase/UDP-sugar diphosphatase